MTVKLTLKNKVWAAAPLLTGLMVACGGSGSNGVATNALDPASFLPSMPSGNEDLNQLFLSADDAFRANALNDAQKLFGQLYILNSDYQGGLPAEALRSTCSTIGISCEMLFARLDFMRSAFHGAYGPAQSWVPQQFDDFNNIVACYDHTIYERHNEALLVGAPLTTAPLPGFAQAAGTCVQNSDNAVQAQRRQEMVDQALSTWFANYDCFMSESDKLYTAWETMDWEEVVRAYPGYQRCEQPLYDVIQGGILLGDATLGSTYGETETAIMEIRQYMQANEATYQATQVAMSVLEQNQGYIQLGVQVQQLNDAELRLMNQIGSAERALGGLNGGARVPVQQQVDYLNSELARLRSDRQGLYDAMNEIRVGLGLSARTSF